MVSMLEGAEIDAPEHPVLRLLLQPQLRDEMPKGHVLCSQSAHRWRRGTKRDTTY